MNKNIATAAALILIANLPAFPTVAQTHGNTPDLDEVVAAYEQAAAAQGFTEFVQRMKEDKLPYNRGATKPEDRARFMAGLARRYEAVLSCNHDSKRYQEAVDYDVIQAKNTFGQYETVQPPQNVSAVFAELTAAADRLFPPQFEPRKWRLKAFEHTMINATAGAGGFIFASSGLWQGVGAIDADELSAVFAHEAAHVALEHSLKLGCHALEWIGDDMTIQDATEIFRDDLSDGFPRKESWKRMSQTFEYEADRAGIDILAAAGADPQGMVKLLARFARQSSSGFSFGSHPEKNERLMRAQRYADQLDRR
jgi:predicted Zn-dependent protease